MDEAELYVRQEAYYNATPEGAKLSRAEQIRRTAEGIATSDMLDDSGKDDGSLPDTPIVSVQELREIPMPEVSDAAGYLVALLRSAGYATPTGMGLVGLTWQEIGAWARCNDFTACEGYRGVLSPRELSALFRLSRAYANEYAVASKKDAKPPYVVEEEIDDEDRKEIENKVEDVFAAMLRAQERD